MNGDLTSYYHFHFVTGFCSTSVYVVVSKMWLCRLVGSRSSSSSGRSKWRMDVAQWDAVGEGIYNWTASGSSEQLAARFREHQWVIHNFTGVSCFPCILSTSCYLHSCVMYYVYPFYILRSLQLYHVFCVSFLLPAIFIDSQHVIHLSFSLLIIGTSNDWWNMQLLVAAVKYETIVWYFTAVTSILTGLFCWEIPTLNWQTTKTGQNIGILLTGDPKSKFGGYNPWKSSCIIQIKSFKPLSI